MTLFPTAGRVLEFPRSESVTVIVRRVARGALPACFIMTYVAGNDCVLVQRSSACITLTQIALCTAAKHNSESYRGFKFSTAINT